MFYDSVMTGVLFYAIVCWSGAIKDKEAGQLAKVSVFGVQLDWLVEVAERRLLETLS